MHDAQLVGGFHRFGDLPRNRQGVLDWHRAGADHVREGWPLDELQNERADAARFFEPVNGGDVRVIECAQHAGFGHEPRDAVVLIGEHARENLERDVATQMLVVRPIDIAHAS